MSEQDPGRRPYRVVFVRADKPGCGTIVLRDEATAHAEARTIAAAGGCAEVQYVEPAGERITLVTYP